MHTLCFLKVVSGDQILEQLSQVRREIPPRLDSLRESFVDDRKHRKFAAKDLNMITLDNVVALAYKTVLNPLVVAILPAAIHFLKGDQFQVQFTAREHYWIPLVSTTPLIKASIYYILGCTAIRLNAYLNRKALNNGVSDRYDFDKEVVVVTGGAGGIGGDVVRQLSTKGTKVAVIDVMPLSYPKPPNVDYYKCDITQPEELHTTAEKIRAKWGSPTILCAIAGIVRAKPLLDLSKRDLDLTFGINVVALASCYKEFVPAMVKQNHGHVVTMASQTAYTSVAGMVDYAASKSAALALHEGLQTELKHVYSAPRVRCSVVLPATVSTQMFAGLTTGSQFMFPVLRPEEVAHQITQALWAGESRHIEMPFLASILMPSTRVLPTWWRVGMQDRARNSMKTFSGRKIMD